MKNCALSVAVVIFALGCGKTENPPPKPSTGSTASPAGVGDYKTQMASAITEQKLAGFAVYQREMIPMMGLTMSVAMGAVKPGATASEMEKAAARDERLKTLTAAQEAACKKAGIQISDISGLTIVTTEYYTKRGIALEFQKNLDETRKSIADAKAAGKEPNPVDASMEKTYAEMLEKEPDVRKEYAAKYGQPLVDLLAKHEAEFIEINKQMLEAALKPQAK